jgi:pimeloyl-ACP methyl ester carboxylesterase
MAGRLLAAGREALALARQATLLHRDLGVVVPELSSGDGVVLLVHGFLATAGVLRPLGSAIERETGARVASFTHPPGASVEHIAARIQAVIRALPIMPLSVHLVGHSVGGLAARFFVEELGGDPRVVGTISIASPFGGTRRAIGLPGPLMRDLVPGSPLLRRLAERRTAVPHLSIAGDRDAVVLDGGSLGGADAIVLEGAAHNSIVYDRRTQRAVIARIWADLARGSASG